jgi:hypothetical protein
MRGYIENKHLHLERGRRLFPMTRWVMLRTGMSSRIVLAVRLLSSSIVSTVTCQTKQVLVSMVLVNDELLSSSIELPLSAPWHWHTGECIFAAGSSFCYSLH